jgi:S-methylmethionine-dependent homocysteine/selenocysteine methylase
MVISGNIGPRGDAYHPSLLMTADQAQAYHSQQVETLAQTDADLVTALTLTYVAEAVGVARAAAAAEIPSAIAFTVETDGRLPDGTTVLAAIQSVDEATDGGPAYYMVNCAHPTHLDSSFGAAAGTGRLRGLRANASRLSHAELDESEVLDDGDPQELGAEFRVLRSLSPTLTIMGGCCGTDLRHIAAIANSAV